MNHGDTKRTKPHFVTDKLQVFRARGWLGWLLIIHLITPNPGDRGVRIIRKVWDCSFYLFDTLFHYVILTGLELGQAGLKLRSPRACACAWCRPLHRAQIVLIFWWRLEGQFSPSITWALGTNNSCPRLCVGYLYGLEPSCQSFPFFLFLLKDSISWDWRDDSAVSSTSYSSRGSNFNSQRPHGTSQLSLNSNSGALLSSFGLLYKHQAYNWFRAIHACKIFINIKIIQSNKRKSHTDIKHIKNKTKESWWVWEAGSSL